jgi:uncharacterized RDD family membrane protein YckC
MVSAISPVPREARAYQGASAGLVTRLVASTVDVLVVCAALLVGYAGFNGLMFAVNPRSFQLSGEPVFFRLATFLVVLTVYMAAAWAITGRTYGNHVMGLRVVGRHGGRVRPVVAIARAVICVILPIGLLLCAGGRSRKSLADMVLRTRVIYDWSPRRPPGYVVPPEGPVDGGPIESS